MSAPIRPVDLAKAYRLLNHGPTVLVSARHQAVDNVMAAAWCCALDFDPPKLTVVIDKATRTRALVEASAGERLALPASTVNTSVRLSYTMVPPLVWSPRVVPR